MTVLTNEPELFDIIELIVNVPDSDRAIRSQGTIVECLDENHFEVEFIDESGETTALCTLSSPEFIVVWYGKLRLNNGSRLPKKRSLFLNDSQTNNKKKF